MQQNEITASRKTVNYTIGFVILVILLVVAIKFPLSGSGQSPNTSFDSSDLVAGSPEKFALLSGQGEQRSIGST